MKIVMTALIVAASSALLVTGGAKQEAQAQTGSHGKTAPLATPFDMSSYFFPSGWMGDGASKTAKYLDVNTAYRAKARSGDTDGLCIRISYKRGPKNWAGVYWQYPDGNWGKWPGRTITGAHRITFWAAGEHGDEVAEFKSGGISDPDQQLPYHDSYEASLGRIRLTAEWTLHAISLEHQNLSNVIGAFACSISGDANPTGAVIYLDDITFD